MLPSGPTTTSLGWLNWPSALPGLPAMPRLRSFSPFGLNLWTWCPLVPCLVAREVGNPHVALPVHVDAMRRHHHALAEVRQHLAGVAIELEDRIDQVVVAVDRPAAGRPRAAALVGPDVSVHRIDVEAGRRAPLPARGKLTPVAGHLRRRVRQPSPVMGFATFVAPGGRRLNWAFAAVRRCRTPSTENTAQAPKSGEQDSRRGHGTSS